MDQFLDELLFHWSIYLSLCWFLTVLITAALWWFLMSGRCVLIFSFSLRRTWAGIDPMLISVFQNQPLLEIIEEPWEFWTNCPQWDSISRSCAYSTCWTHSCHPPQLAFKLPRKHFLIHLWRKESRMCLSLNSLCLLLAHWLLRFPCLWLSPHRPTQGTCKSFQKAACFPAPVCQGHNSGLTEMCLPLTMPGSWRELPTPELGMHSQILWLRYLQIFALPENRVGGWVGDETCH